MAAEPPQRFNSYQDFLNADSRRLADALEIGHDFVDDADGRYRVCFYVNTGEVTIERLVSPDSLDVEDFYSGIAGVEIVCAGLSRAELDRALGSWPTVGRCQPRTLERLRALMDDHPRLRAVR